MSIACGNGDVRYVVLDFGLARALDRDSEPLTREGAILGTPQYMAPEAARGESAILASDVYSLATILYELIAGNPPFRSGPPMSILLQQAQSESPPLPEEMKVPPGITSWLQRQLSKSPDARCADARQLALELVAIAIADGVAPESMVSANLTEETLARLGAGIGRP
jgi:serine/threonine-protein kinase